MGISLFTPRTTSADSLCDEPEEVDIPKLIREAESMKDGEVEGWLRRLPRMSKDQLKRLCELLMNEKLQLLQLDMEEKSERGQSTEEEGKKLRGLREEYRRKEHGPFLSPEEEQVKNISEDPDTLLKEIEIASNSQDYRKTAALFDKLFSIPGITFSDGNLYAFAVNSYDSAGQYRKSESTCERGSRESNRGDAGFINLLETCYESLILKKTDPEKGLRYLLTKYSLQTGITDNQAILAKIALNQNDALLAVAALQNAGKYQEAADLLVFYFKTNPSLMEWRDWGEGHKQCPGCLIAGELKSQGTGTASDYLETRRTEERWARGIERVLKIAVPIIVVGGAIIEHDYDQREKARIKAQREAEEAARQRQIARDQENARRRAQGLPSLEEEERRESERREAIRGQTRARCLENCETRYHSCMGITDMKCCGDRAPYLGCNPPYCPTVCETGLSSCRNKCD